MTEAETLAARLVAAGLDQLLHAAKSRLFATALDRWCREALPPYTGAWWVPGRLEVFGTHTDYAGGRSLVAPVPRGFAFLAAPRSDGEIHVVDAGAAAPDEIVIVRPDQPATQFRGWRHYVEVTAGRLRRNFPGSALGADIAFASDLPRAAGMSSSSALVVGIATALVHVAGLRDRDEWQRNVRTAIDEAGYLACVENGRTFGGLTGDAGVGTHGGSEDHAAMLAGTAGQCSAFAFVPMRHLDTIPVPARWSIIVSSSGIGSHKTGAEKSAYNRLSAGTSALLDLWNQAEAPGTSLAAALASATDAGKRLRELVDRSSVPDWTAADLRDRLDHFEREDARIAAAVLALRTADAAALGQAAAQSQHDSETLLRNQVPETSSLVRLAVDAGAAAARSFGAGFGGSVWAVVERTDAAAFADRWLSAYRATHPEAGERAVVFESNPGPPVTRVDV